jgi:hypothetical protein
MVKYYVLMCENRRMRLTEIILGRRGRNKRESLKG